jgi:uncharacterized sporulation protein YeaH/YhbH (DUF444 family)
MVMPISFGPGFSSMPVSLPRLLQRPLGRKAPAFGYGDGIDLDKDRFWKKVHEQQKGKFWENIVYDNVVVNPDKGISYPAPWIEQPTFVPRQPGKGVGQGEGEEGDAIGQGQSGTKPGEGKPGDKPGQHQLEHWQSPQDMMTWLREFLKLPNLKFKPGGGMEDLHSKYDREKRRPPGSVLMKPTFKRAIKRSAAEAIGRKGVFDPAIDLTFQPSHDFVYRTDRQVPKPKNKTVVFMIRDVSGSMQKEEKERSRIHAWLLEMIYRDMSGKERAEEDNRTYTSADFWDSDNFQLVYINHDTVATEVTAKNFYEESTGGGTLISSAYQLTHQIINSRFPTHDWNVYVNHFSDGDDWQSNQSIEALEALYRLGVNRMAFVDVGREGYAGSFTKILYGRYGQKNPWLSLTGIGDTHNPKGYADSIRTILSSITEEVPAS